MKYFSAIIFGFVLFFTITNPIFSQEANIQDDLTKMILNSNARTIFKLNGYWETTLDDGTSGSFYLPKVFYNCEKATFKKTIHIDKKLLPNSVWHLYFLGLNDEIEIYWNSQFIGKFVSDGAPLWVTIPKKLIVKEANEILLVVNPVQSIAYQIRRNYQYFRKIVTGISRDFFLVRTSPVWVNSFSYSFNFESLSKVDIKTRVNISSFEINTLLRSAPNLVSEQKLFFKLEQILRSKETNQIVAQSNPQIFNISSFRNIVLENSMTVVNPNLWDPENPFLYTLELRISYADSLLDNLIFDFGITKIETTSFKNGNSRLLNGKPFVLKAVDFIEDYDYYNSGKHIQKFEADIKNLKSLGANAVRFLFGSPNPIFLNLANRYGLLVLVDLPVYYVPSTLLKKSDLFIRFQTISENICRHLIQNPSLFAIGVGNGLETNSPDIKYYYSKLTQWIKQYGRLETYGSYLLGQKLDYFDNFDFVVINDNFRLARRLDLVFSFLKDYKEQVKKPLIFSFGTIIDPNNHKGYNNQMSVEYQAYYLLERFNIQNKIGLAGVLVWSYNDYFTENPLSKSAPIEPYTSFSGIQNNTQQRLAFNVLKALFNNEDVPIINPGLPESELRIDYIVAGIVALLIWGFMLNRSRRFREYTYRSAFRTYNFFADIRDKRIISEFQTATFGFVLALIIATFLSAVLNYYRTNEGFQLLTGAFIPNYFVREWLYKLAWNPLLAIVVFTIAACLKILLLALLLKIASFFVRSKIFFDDTFKMVIWALQPIILLLPVAVFINRILPISTILTYSFHIFFLIVILWCLQRLIKSIWIVFDVRPSKAFFWTILFLFVVALIYFSILEYSYNLIEYIVFYNKIIVLWNQF